MKEPDFTAEKGYRDFNTYAFLKNRTLAPKLLENINLSFFGQNQELAEW